MSLNARNNDLFKTNVWWTFNFEKHADCLAISLARPVHVQFFLRRFFKLKVYETKPQDLEEMKTKIRHHAAAIPKTMLAKV